MKTIKNIFVIVAFGLLILWTGCNPTEEFSIVATWELEKVIPPEGFIESGDWTSFEIKFESGLTYTTNNVFPGYEVLWTTDPTLFSSGGGAFSSGTYVYTAATTTTAATAVLNEPSGGSFTIEVEADDGVLDKMTLLVSPNVDISGRVSGIEDPWEFEMKKKE